MNKFLLLKPGVRILAGTTPASVATQVRGWFTEAGWQTMDGTATENFYALPPATEAIGNSLAAEILRVEFTSAGLTLQFAALNRQPLFKRWYIQSSNGNYAPSIKIGTQSFSGSAGANRDDATTKLYTALKNSAAPEATAYDFVLVPGPAADDDYIVATEKQVGGGQTIAVGNYTAVYQWGDSWAAGSAINRGGLSRSFSINYGQDWVLFASLTSRTAAFGVRTLSGGYLGPLTASWTRNSDATGQTPPDCHPVELTITDTSAPWSSGAQVGFGHYFGYTRDRSAYDVFKPVIDASTMECSPVSGAGKFRASPVVVDAHGASYGSPVPGPVAGFPGGLPLASGSDQPVNYLSTASVGGIGPIYFTGARVSTNYGTGWLPPVVLPDVCMFYQSGDNESTLATRSAAARTQLAAPIDASVNSITVTDASALAPKGTVIIGSEIINYASISGNTLQGCERGKASTQPAPHTTQEDVFRAFWWIRINYGALPAGPVDPATLG